MRLTPWFLPLALSAALLTTTSYVFADNHEPLDDEALEEEYGIKAGSVKRDEETSSDSDQSNDQTRSREEEEEEENSDNDNSGEESSGAEETREGEDDVALEPGESEERNPEAGTGGTGSPDDAIHSSEEENSDDEENDDGTDDSE